MYLQVLGTVLAAALVVIAYQTVSRFKNLSGLGSDKLGLGSTKVTCEVTCIDKSMFSAECDEKDAVECNSTLGALCGYENAPWDKEEEET